MRTSRPIVCCLVAISLLLAACGDSSDQGAPFESPAPTDGEPDRTRSDVDCSDEAIGGDIAEFTTVHLVVDGVLGEPCLGAEDPTLLAAWDVLAVIAPTLARADLRLFAGFVGPDGGEAGDDEVTLAFVNSIDDDGTLFQMSVNLDSFDDDETEAFLTIAHEFSHVFAQVPSQLDRSPEAEESCATYDNGEGCFVEGSLMAEWIAEFWADGPLDDLDPTVEPSVISGEDRCSLNADYLGPYAASDPEEDFAETFSAFVFDLDVDPALDAKLDWMAARPGLVEFRDRAVEAGLTPLDNSFELCG